MSNRSCLCGLTIPCLSLRTASGSGWCRRLPWGTFCHLRAPWDPGVRGAPCMDTGAVVPGLLVPCPVAPPCPRWTGFLMCLGQHFRRVHRPSRSPESWAPDPTRRNSHYLPLAETRPDSGIRRQVMLLCRPHEPSAVPELLRAPDRPGFTLWAAGPPRISHLLATPQCAPEQFEQLPVPLLGPRCLLPVPFSSDVALRPASHHGPWVRPRCSLREAGTWPLPCLCTLTASPRESVSPSPLCCSC